MKKKTLEKEEKRKAKIVQEEKDKAEEKINEAIDKQYEDVVKIN